MTTKYKELILFLSLLLSGCSSMSEKQKICEEVRGQFKDNQCRFIPFPGAF